MSFFPSIRFVDEMPEDVIQSMHLKANERLIGAYVWNFKQIYVLKGKKKTLILLHELAHWVIQTITSARGNNSYQQWFDKYFTVNRKIT